MGASTGVDAPEKRRRFCWDSHRDDTLVALWPDADLPMLAELIGCSVSQLYKRAAHLGLAPRDPVRRAMLEDDAPRDPLRLPSYDEMRAAARGLRRIAA